MAQYSRRYSVVMSKWHFTWCWNAFITLVALHNSKLPECIYTEGHIAFIPGWFALKRMYMSDCTFAMSDCISQMLETHFGNSIYAHVRWAALRLWCNRTTLDVDIPFIIIAFFATASCNEPMSILWTYRFHSPHFSARRHETALRDAGRHIASV